ncbi:hypothetical protein O3P69_006809 [Scylla paramamosain]|uniref:Uncharacterized protein n=1 Tax=Scylla paramamosain TaxID=85552 RepID=A0AAW0U130_SCYPA
MEGCSESVQSPTNAESASQRGTCCGVSSRLDVGEERTLTARGNHLLHRLPHELRWWKHEENAVNECHCESRMH